MAPSKTSKASTSQEEPEKRGRGRPLGSIGTGRKKRKTPLPKNWKLSKELAAIVGPNVTVRHQVIKKLWALIKERDLKDPDNGAYTICDAQFLKVFEVKRFRTWGMAKYLQKHYIVVE